MKTYFRLHVLGASGSGTSTLGKRLARELDIAHIDADDIFWEPTDPPYSVKRTLEARIARLRELTSAESWVLSGSVTGWGDFLRTRFTHVIFLTLPARERLDRLRARERARFGPRISAGGDLEKQHHEFLDWAARYDAGGLDVRSLALHERWLRDLPCPVLRLSGLSETEGQARNAAAFMAEQFDFSVAELPGVEAASIVDPFYAACGRAARARPDDHFFVARSGLKTLGCVRFCVENREPLLRSMLVTEVARKRGVGRKLLAAFDRHLREGNVRNTFCLPHLHLESFYATIGFSRLPEGEGPAFLRERQGEYLAEGMNAILMRRP